MSAVAERAGIASREAFAALARLFRYPEESPVEVLSRAGGEAAELDAFLNEISQVSLAELQSAYTATFDLAPSCSPYLGVHLFGEEMRDRARLMVGLRQCGVSGPELPDHVAEVLAFAPHFRDDEWAELVDLVLAPALGKMGECLRESRNPWRHLIAAAAALCSGGAS